MELRDCINYMLTRAQNSVFNHFKSKLAPLGVTPVQYSVLRCLWDGGDQSPTKIAGALCLDTSTVTGIFDRMEKKELIERVHSATDRRAVNVRICAAGLAPRPGIEAAVADANEEVPAGVDPEHFTALQAALDRIVPNAEGLAVH